MEFAHYVVEKEKNDIYLTRMNSELSEENAWKSKIIVDRMVIEQLPQHLLPSPPNSFKCLPPNHYSSRSSIGNVRDRSSS